MSSRPSSSRPAPERQSPDRPPEGAVVLLMESATCAQCDTKVRAGEPLRPLNDPARAYVCLSCAGLTDLVYLPSGDPALTRRASKLSPRVVVAVAWNRRRKRWERRGTLVEADALAKAEAECVLDADRRAAAREKARQRAEAADRLYREQFAATIREEFPGLDPETAARIAEHACEKHSGRVGRTAAARALDREMVTLAVIAHARHLHTNYDDLRDAGLNKRDSRRMISPQVKALLEEWRREKAGTGEGEVGR